MSIEVWLSHNNLAFRICQSPSFKEDKERLKFISGKIPIYNLDKFDHWEIDKHRFGTLKEVFGDKILVRPEAQEYLKNFQIQISRLQDLPKQRVDIKSLDGKELRNYQEDYVGAYYKRKGLLLLYDTGLGKSLSATLRAANLGFNLLLVVCQANLIPEWKKDLKLMLDIDALVYTGATPKAKRELLDLTQQKAIICNFEMLKELESRLPKNLDSIIIDEAHNIATGNSYYKAAKKIIRKAQKNNDASVQLLTATPKEDSLEDFWILTNLVNPELAGDKAEFLKKYQEVTKYTQIKLANGQIWRKPAGFRTKNEAEFKDFISRAGSRISKEFHIMYEDVNKIIPVDMTKKQAQVYLEVKDEVLLLANDRTFYLENPLVRLGKLLQAAEGAYNIYPDMLESGKLDYLEKVEIPEAQKAGKKVIFWWRYVKGSEIVHSWLPNSCVLYNGNQPPALKYLSKLAFQGANTDLERDEFYRLLEKYPDFPFKTPGSAQFMSATYSKRSASGLNFQSCDTSVVLSFDYSSNSFKQAVDRIKRLDTKFDRLYTKLVISDKTIEKKYVPLMLTKLEQNARVLDGVGSSESIKAKDIIRMIKSI